MDLDIQKLKDEWGGSGGFTLLDEGEHLCYVSEVKPGVTKAGDPKVECEFAIHDPASPHQGYVLKYQSYSMAEKARAKFAQLVFAANPECKRLNPTVAGDLDAALFGRVVVIQVKHNTSRYNGQERTRAQVSGHRAPSAQEQERLRQAYGESMTPLAFDDDDLAF